MIRFGAAAAPRWFEQRSGSGLDDYLDHLVANSASSSSSSSMAESRATKPSVCTFARRHWLPAIFAAQSRGLDVHLHAPFTPEYRLTAGTLTPAALGTDTSRSSTFSARSTARKHRPPVLVMHAASFPEGNATSGEEMTGEFIAWLLRCA